MHLHHPESREAQRQEHLADAISRHVDEVMNDGWTDVLGPDGVTAISIESVVEYASHNIGKAFMLTDARDLPGFGERLREILEANARILVLKAMGVTP